MADAASNWIDFFISLAPVVQTGIWAGVALSVAYILRAPLTQLSLELVARVKQGDDLETKFFSLKQKEGRERIVVENITENIRKEINTPFTCSSDLDISSFNDKLSGILDEIGNNFIELIFPFPAFRTIDHHSAQVSLYATDWQSVSDFLNDAYNLAIESGVDLPMWTYGKYWQFRNERTGGLIRKTKTGPTHDGRPFTEIDVTPGDRLVAERI